MIVDIVVSWHKPVTAAGQIVGNGNVRLQQSVLQDLLSEPLMVPGGVILWWAEKWRTVVELSS